MKISEKNLPFAQKRKFRRQRLFHFHDHVRPFKNFFSGLDNLRTGFDIILVRITGAKAGVLLCDNQMPAPF